MAGTQLTSDGSKVGPAPGGAPGMWMSVPTIRRGGDQGGRSPHYEAAAALLSGGQVWPARAALGGCAGPAAWCRRSQTAALSHGAPYRIRDRRGTNAPSAVGPRQGSPVVGWMNGLVTSVRMPLAPSTGRNREPSCSRRKNPAPARVDRSRLGVTAAAPWPARAGRFRPPTVGGQQPQRRVRTGGLSDLGEQLSGTGVRAGGQSLCRVEPIPLGPVHHNPVVHRRGSGLEGQPEEHLRHAVVVHNESQRVAARAQLQFPPVPLGCRGAAFARAICVPSTGRLLRSTNALSGLFGS